MVVAGKSLIMEYLEEITLIQLLPVSIKGGECQTFNFGLLKLRTLYVLQ